jgi:nucleotide-binding universal stress UspA family protein
MSLLDVQRVVVPVDFSDESKEAVARAMELAGADPQRVYLIHVLAEMSPADPGVTWGEISDDNRMRHVIQAMAEQGLHEDARQMHLHVEFGDAGFRIAHFAEDIEADLIVISSHGRTGFQRLLIGSVAERVIRYAHCPVLVLRRATSTE